MAHMVTSMSGSWLMLSAASREFSTSSRIVVYRHFPACSVLGRAQPIMVTGVQAYECVDTTY